MTEETAWEQLTFVPGLLGTYRPSEYDKTATCAYPLTNWTLRRPVPGGRKPRHVFITQCGDWPAVSNAGRFHQITLPADQMPLLYRSADVFMHLSVDE